MHQKSERLYKPAEFARLAGVTVRTLHYYDRLRLLEPRRRTVRGHRLYIKSDLVRLQQILTLKFIGLPLKQIKLILDQDSFDLAKELRRQRELISQQGHRLKLTVETIERVECVLSSTDEPDWKIFTEIIEGIKAADNWLAMISAGDYATAWRQTSALFKEGMWTPSVFIGGNSEHQWKSSLMNLQTQVGKAMSRNLLPNESTEKFLWGLAPPAVTLRYATSFENKKNGIETVIVQKDQEGVSRVSDYRLMFRVGTNG
jgi:DNA-binding transcriptional MerR regulator